MFKKTKIAAVSAAILGLSNVAANAAVDGELSINEAGSAGQVLVFPYYNVNNAFVTRFNVTNTTGDYKAIKVRFRESENSNDVLDFNLYLSPYDVYSMLLSGKDGGVVLKTSDTSCTHPAIPAEGQMFRHDAYASTSKADVREGYLEIIEMGVVAETATVDVVEGSATVTKVVTLDGIQHVDGVPADCSLIKQAWIDGAPNGFIQGGAKSNSAFDSDTVNPKPKTIYSSQPTSSESGWYGDQAPLNMLPPTGGLVGSSILVSLSNFSGYVAEPIAVENYSSVPQHYLSSDENFYLLPALASGNATATADGSFVTVNRDWGLDDVNVLPRTSVPSGINPMPLADALLVTELGNQYFLADGQLSDWVISAPMRKHAIWNNYQYTMGSTGYNAGSMVDSGEVDESGSPILLPVGDIPVGEEFGFEGTPAAFWDAKTGDINASFVYFDREEGQAAPTDDDEFSPPLVTPSTEIPFESEVNILAFNTGDANKSVLGSDNARGITVKDGFVVGWGGLTFNSDFDLNATRYQEWTTVTSSAPGVPVFGFLAVEADFGPGTVGETFPHFYNRVRTAK